MTPTSPTIAITSSSPSIYHEPFYAPIFALVHHHYTEFLNTTVKPAISTAFCPNLPDGWCRVSSGIVAPFEAICHTPFTSSGLLCWPVEKPWYYTLVMVDARPDWWAGTMCALWMVSVVFLVLYIRFSSILKEGEWFWEQMGGRQ